MREEFDASASKSVASCVEQARLLRVGDLVEFSRDGILHRGVLFMAPGDEEHFRMHDECGELWTFTIGVRRDGDYGVRYVSEKVI